MSLQNCPEEIQDSILEMLLKADLLSMSLVDSHWHFLVERILFSDVELRWNKWHIPPITLLCRSLIERPSLSDYVRRLHLRGVRFDGGQYSPNYLPKFSADAQHIGPLLDAIDRIEGPWEYAEFWKRKLRAGTMDAFVALLVSLLPNLNSLTLNGYFTINNKFLGDMFRLALCHKDKLKCNLPQFQNLHHVDFFDWGYKFRPTGLRSPEDAIPLFYLPAIRRLELMIDNPVKVDWVNPGMPTHTPLQSLYLMGLREAYLPALFSKLKGIREVKWSWSHRGPLDTEVSDRVIDLDKIAEATHHVRDSLTDLIIHASAMRLMNPLKQTGSLNGFTHLAKLERLEIPWVFLMGFSPSSKSHLGDAIPQSTKCLILTDHLFENETREWETNSITHELKMELHKRKCRYGSLEEIDIRLPPWNQTSFKRGVPKEFEIKLWNRKSIEESQEEFDEIAAQAGIKLIWPKLTPFGDMTALACMG
ncbi:hypothetical protein BGZ63DRAFT_407012 [Mariannaea sp. PMI_226]|nr:hypothetical protein BGZ63DRAFT_407012 [Mariannaea sp. PMI_226]